MSDTNGVHELFRSGEFKTSTGGLLIISSRHVVAVLATTGYVQIFTTCRPEPFMVIDDGDYVLEELGL